MISWRLATLGLLAAFLLVLPGAMAHGEAVTSIPSAGERLGDSPTHVSVTFNEVLYREGSWIQVWDLSGERWDRDDLTVAEGDHPKLTVGVQELPEGPYYILWQAYSASDGHVVRGTIGFSVGGYIAPNVTGQTDEVPVGAAIARALTYIGYTLAIGALAFDRMVLRKQVRQSQRRALDGALVLGAGLHLVGITWLLVHTVLAAQLSFATFLASAGGRDLWMRLIVATTLAVVTGLWLYGPHRPRTSNVVLGFLWLLAVALGARFGHGTSPSTWFVQSIHGISIAIWVGGLIMLFVHLFLVDDKKKGAKHAQLLGLHFSTMALGAITAIAFTGMALALTIVGTDLFDPRLWFQNNWRTFLSLKIALALGMIALAIVNRELFVEDGKKVGPIRKAIRRFADQKLRWQAVRETGGVNDFRKVVGVEMTFGLAILVLAGLLMSVGAPLGTATVDLQSFESLMESEDYAGFLVIHPEPSEGHFSDIRIQIADHTGIPLEENSCTLNGTARNDCITVQWWHTRDNETVAQNLTGIPDGEGWWLFKQAQFNTSGIHELQLTIETGAKPVNQMSTTFRVLRDG